MPPDDGTPNETGSPVDRPEKYDTDRSIDPDTELTYDEAVERDDFVYAEVYTTQGQPEDCDQGMLRRDYDDPTVEYALMIRKGETGTTKIKTATISKIDLGRDPNRDGSGVLG